MRPRPTQRHTGSRILSTLGLAGCLSICFLLAGAGVSCAAAPGRNLIANGRSDYRIVLPDAAIPAEETAARELQEHLLLITGVELEIIRAADYVAGPMVAVGFNDKLPPELQATAYGTLGEEELLIDVHGETLLLAGGRPRGALYAVYEFLDRLGVRWYTPEYTHITAQDSIALPTERYRYSPPLLLRSYLQNNRPTRQWTARNRMNQFILWSHPGQEYGGGEAQGPDMHTFWRLIPQAELRANPEWAAWVDGQREATQGTNHWGLCLSNPEVQEILIKRTLDYARNNPDKKAVWLAHNDSSSYCRCSDCQDFYDAHGGKPSALMMTLVNNLADIMAVEMPDRMVKTLAYSYSQDPPENMTMRDNVIVMFCAWSRYYLPIADDPHCQPLRDRAKGWVNIAKNVETYLYQFPVDNYWFPTPNLLVTPQDIQWAYRTGINRIYMHLGGGATGDGSELVDLRAWVYARMMWNPRLDAKELVEEFARDYYGPAAETVLQALRMTNVPVFPVFDADGQMIVRNDNEFINRPFLDPELIRAINHKIEAAYDRLVDEPIYRQRLQYVWIPYLWADVWLGFSGPGRYDPESGAWAVAMDDGPIRQRYGAMCKQFMREAEVSALRELIRLNPDLLAIDMMGVPFPAVRLSDSRVEVAAVPELAGHIFEFRDKQLDFAPLADYWGIVMHQYPIHGPWRDYVNGSFVRSFQLVEDSARRAAYEAVHGSLLCRKTITLDNAVLTSSWSARALEPTTARIYQSPMFSLAQDAFGKYPVLFQKNRDGHWTRTVLGEGYQVHYYTAGLDISEAAGMLVLASQTRAEGLAISFDPEQIEAFSIEYDRHFDILHLKPTSPQRDLQADEVMAVTIDLQILADAEKWMAENTARDPAVGCVASDLSKRLQTIQAERK